MHRPTMLLAMLAALISGSQAAGYELKRDSSGEPVRWDHAAVLSIDEGLDAALGAVGAREAVEAAVRALEGQVPAPGFEVATGRSGKVGYDFSAKATNRNDVVAVSTWPYDADAVAITIVTVDRTRHTIVDADIAFNASGSQWEVVDPRCPSPGRYDVRNAFTHELGHFAGLAHSQEPEAAMFPHTYAGDVQKRTFNTDDRAGLESLYPAAPEADPVTGPVGCSTTSGPAMSLLALAALVLGRRRRVAVAVLLLAPMLAAQADEKNTAPRRLVVVARVTSARTLAPEQGAAVLKTELTVEVADCLDSPCPTALKLFVPGGTWGNFTQTVGGVEVPAVGDLVGLVRAPLEGGWVRLERLSDAAAKQRFLAQQRLATR